MASSEGRDGGPAFPTMRSEVGGVDGMSLRQWYAGQAIAGMASIANANWYTEYHPETQKQVAQNAVALADALLAALAKDTPL